MSMRQRVGQQEIERFLIEVGRVHDLVVLLKEAGFDRLETEEVPPARSSSFPGVGFICAFKSAEEENR
jgi:hypothetical protein